MTFIAYLLCAGYYVKTFIDVSLLIFEEVLGSRLHTNPIFIQEKIKAQIDGPRYPFIKL